VDRLGRDPDTLFRLVVGERAVPVKDDDAPDGLPGLGEEGQHGSVGASASR
jgi:hypothetical protein